MAEINFNALNDEALQRLESDDLISIVKALNEENKKLKKSADKKITLEYEARLEKIEREMNKDRQYLRRDTIEISGIDDGIDDEEIEATCLKLLKFANVKVGTKTPTTNDIHAAHRKGKKGTVILKFTNRKFAEFAMKNRDKFRDNESYKNMYINQSLCPEFSYLSYALRCAKRNKVIHSIKFKHGVPMAKKTQRDDFVEVSHESDLVKYGIDAPPRSK